MLTSIAVQHAEGQSPVVPGRPHLDSFDVHALPPPPLLVAQRQVQYLRACLLKCCTPQMADISHACFVLLRSQAPPPVDVLQERPPPLALPQRNFTLHIPSTSFIPKGAVSNAEKDGLHPPMIHRYMSMHSIGIQLNFPPLHPTLLGLNACLRKKSGSSATIRHHRAQNIHETKCTT